VRNPELDDVLLILIVFDQFEFCVVVGFGATRTMLGIELCTIKVAVIVAWVLGRAFACPLHMPNASMITDSVKSLAVVTEVGFQGFNVR
jgi:hypothetical protein